MMRLRNTDCLNVSGSVADPGCLSRIRIQPFFGIPDPDPTSFIPDPDPGSGSYK
jgi:hypothetical protein